MPQAIARNTTTTPPAPSRAEYERDVLVTLAGLFNPQPPANDTAALALTACPCCGSAPAIDPSFHSRAVIYCDNDDCEDRPQAMGDTIALAAAIWSQRIEDRELV